jgi:hypothetical protein
MQREAKLDNPFVKRFVEYFRACAERETSAGARLTPSPDK